jgi:hypothetical protein
VLARHRDVVEEDVGVGVTTGRRDVGVEQEARSDVGAATDDGSAEMASRSSGDTPASGVRDAAFSRLKVSVVSTARCSGVRRPSVCGTTGSGIVDLLLLVAQRIGNDRRSESPLHEWHAVSAPGGHGVRSLTW